MSRDSNGNYVLPAGNPVVSDTTIDSVWANDSMGDIATTLTNSLDRDGKGGMRAPLKMPDSSAALPSFSFTNQTNTGMYRFGDGDLRFSVGGADSLRLTTGSSLSVIGLSQVNFTGGDFDFSDGIFDMSGGTATVTGGEITITQGVYTLSGDGLFQTGDQLYIGIDATAPEVLTTGNLTAALVPYDNTIVNAVPATNVQAAIDILSAGGFIYGSIAQTGGGVLTAGILNRLLDSSTYTLPLASSTQIGTLIEIAVPSTALGQTPLVQRSGADVITWAEGNDTELLFESPSTIQLASNGVDTWEY